MRQLLQNLSNGQTEIVEAPAPPVSRGSVLVDSALSLVSAGTERMLVDFGKAGLIAKARQQPEKVKMVLEKVKTDGLAVTIDAVRSKLRQPIALGYSNVGVVSEAGPDVSIFKPGDRVVSNGRHADIVRVPGNLCAKIPDSVDDETAAFTVVASIGLQGIRLAGPTLGESFVVIGAGLIGLLTIQLLRAQGCRVLAVDIDEAKLSLAREFGADTCNTSNGEDPVSAGLFFSGRRGVDGVIITASSESNDLVSSAAKMCRKRGRIVLVGVVGLKFNRADFYEKELSFQVSCSYGPGRYDPEYEDGGHDYPLGFVRWTEQRNFEAVLQLMAEGRLNVKPLISHRFDFENAADAYDSLSAGSGVLGIILRYNREIPERHKRTVELGVGSEPAPHEPAVAFIGAGNYAYRVLIPGFKRAGAHLHTIATRGSTNGVVHGKKAGFRQATTDVDSIFTSEEINTVVVATRHDSHAAYVNAALKAGKNVFVEKPLAISGEQLDDIERAYAGTRHGDGTGPLLMVGFNRRFSPFVVKMKELLAELPEPKAFITTMNAGHIPGDHWTQDVKVGGGRIIGEACHHIDLLRFLAGCRIVSVQARKMGDIAGLETSEDKTAIVLGFADGSLGTIHYFANGNKAFPKERVEAFCSGGILQLDNFRKLKGYGFPRFRKSGGMHQDKGQKACPAAFLDALRTGGRSPIPSEELFEVARTTLEVAEQARTQ